MIETKSNLLTLREAAQTALDVQDACNLSGVVRSFAEVTQVLWDEAHKIGEGTEWVNSHPITLMFVDKLADLSGQPVMNYGQAYRDVRRLAELKGV